MSCDPRFDEVLFGILNHVGGIDKFLDAMFSFLYRRTDFFQVRKDSSEKLGLPPGVAQKMVKVICQRYVDVEKAKNPSPKAAAPKAPPAKEHKEPLKPTKEKPSAAVKADPVAPLENSPSRPVDKTQEVHDVGESNTESAGTAPVAEKKPEKTEDGERKYYDSNPECYNGASYDTYSFAQDIYSLDVQVKVPNSVKGGEQVKVNVTRNQLTVEVFHEDKWQVLLDGTFSYDVRKEESTWSLHPHDHIHIHLEKAYERYWEALLEGEPKINVRAIDCSKPYEDLEPEAQAKLQEMMFDQHQKMLGKPTSKQLKVQDALKQAWNKKGSPYEGQEFDPSQFNIAE